MTARDEILERVRQRMPRGELAPRPTATPIVYPDLRQQFAAVLAAIGGRCVTARDRAEAQCDLDALPAYQASRRRCSSFADLGAPNVDLAGISDPHALADVDFAVLPGELAVAENGAVWVATDSVLERTLYFLTQHLAIVVPADRIVHQMHAAYQQADVSRRRFGAFVAGPSKTADIEQALVIGAHGARSLTVYLIGAAP